VTLDNATRRDGIHLALARGMTTKSEATSRQRGGTRRRRRSRRRARAATPHGVRIRLRAAAEHAREAGEAGLDAARVAATFAGERLDAAAGEARERVRDASEGVGRSVAEAGRMAAGVGIRDLRRVVGRGARRSIAAVERAGSRAVVRVIDAGTRVLGAAADLVADLSPRRRANHAGLEQVLVDHLGWANAAAEAYDRAATEVADGTTRVRLVRLRLEAASQAEALGELLAALGRTAPTEERAPVPKRADADGAQGPAAERHALACALTAAVQNAEGWRGLGAVAASAESDRIADALSSAVTSVGDAAEMPLDFLRGALLTRTLDTALI
jgi:hypothetical protein